jgi:hypothetical protein
LIWKKKSNAEGYALNVKDEIKEIDTKKLNGYGAEINALTNTIESFSKMLLE